MSIFHPVILQCLFFAGLSLVLFIHYMPREINGSAVRGMKCAGLGTCYSFYFVFFLNHQRL